MKFRVRSIFAKIVLWFVATVALSLVGFLATSILLSERLSGRDTITPRMSTIFLDDARRAYEEGGTDQLAAYLKRLDAHSDAQHFLTDGRGIDLVTGEDRSDLRRVRRPAVRRLLPAWLMSSSGPIVRVRTSDDRRYRLITVIPPPPRLGAVGYAPVFRLAAPLDRRTLLLAGRSPRLAAAQPAPGRRSFWTR